MSVVAEDVEAQAQSQLLVSPGCESLQGYLLHHPIAVPDARALLDERAGNKT